MSDLIPRLSLFSFYEPASTFDSKNVDNNIYRLTETEDIEKILIDCPLLGTTGLDLGSFFPKAQICYNSVIDYFGNDPRYKSNTSCSLMFESICLNAYKDIASLIDKIYKNNPSQLIDLDYGDQDPKEYVAGLAIQFGGITYLEPIFETINLPQGYINSLYAIEALKNFDLLVLSSHDSVGDLGIESAAAFYEHYIIAIRYQEIKDQIEQTIVKRKTKKATQARSNRSMQRKNHIIKLWKESKMSENEFAYSQEYLEQIRAYSIKVGLTPLTITNQSNNILGILRAERKKLD